MEIIAEIGQNHNGDMVLAKELINAAKENGADVAKFQIFDALETFGKKNNDWYEYNCKTQLSKDDVHYLAEVCEKENIEFMSSVFHSRYIEWLEEINVKRYKIASRSIYDHVSSLTGRVKIVNGFNYLVMKQDKKTKIESVFKDGRI